MRTVNNIQRGVLFGVGFAVGATIGGVAFVVDRFFGTSWTGMIR